jgi:hypothetical protein
MPEIAAFVQSLREAFGDAVDDAVAKGKRGEPGFYGRENGREVGVRPTGGGSSWRVDASFADRHFCPGCAGDCIGSGARCSERIAQRTPRSQTRSKRLSGS